MLGVLLDAVADATMCLTLLPLPPMLLPAAVAAALEVGFLLERSTGPAHPRARPQAEVLEVVACHCWEVVRMD